MTSTPLQWKLVVDAHDLHGPAGERDTGVERLRALGARVESHVKEPGGEWVVMTDPEGNEFCVH